MKRKQSEGRRRIYSLLMNCPAPVLTGVFLAGSACWAAELQYGESVEYDRSPEATAVLSENGLSLLPDEYTEAAMPVSEIAVMNNLNSGAELVEACGIYIGDEFV